MQHNDFEPLFKSNFSKLCSVANKIVRNADVAKDIVQDVFLKIWNRNLEITDKVSISFYLHKATVNASLNYLESRKNVIPLTQQINAGQVESTDRAALSELEKYVGRAIDKLPPQCKTIFILSRFEGMKYQQIADQLDISVKTVENQMARALRQMREDLKPFLTAEFITTVISIGISIILPFLSFVLAFRLIF